MFEFEAFQIFCLPLSFSHFKKYFHAILKIPKSSNSIGSQKNLIKVKKVFMETESSSVAKAPFKSAAWLQKKKEHKAAKHSKQNKNLKQICTNELTNNSQRINCINHINSYFGLTTF